MLALSQLSYGPGSRKCSYELVVPCPMNLAPLIVPRRRYAKAHGRSTDRHLEREEIAGVELLAVRGYRIDLPANVASMDEPVRPATASPATHGYNVAVQDRPLALDA